MAEQSLTVEQVFCKDQFITNFGEWRGSADEKTRAEGLLAEELAKRYEEDEAMSRSDIAYTVSGEMEMDAEMAEAIFWDSSIVELFRTRDTTRGQLAIVKREIVEGAKSAGLNQFAVYGLSRHINNTYIEDPALLQASVIATEQKFREVDQLVRDNVGEVLLVIGGLTIAAARLGEGGIKLEGRSTPIPNVVIPYSGKSVYTAGQDPKYDRIFSSTRFEIGATDIDAALNGRSSIVPASDLLNISEVWQHADRGAVFAVGEVPAESEPLIVNGIDAEYLSDMMRKIREVGHAATHNLEVPSFSAVYDRQPVSSH